MKRKCFLLVLALLAILVLLPSSAQAADNITVKIDGKLRSFNPGPEIANDRTMVPIRFVVEDEALKGQVSWDNEARKVTINSKGSKIDLYIDSTLAFVNGQGFRLDTAPYISNDRTYVPLRFIAENLGAAVGWKSAERQVVINFDYNPRVFAYYYRSWKEFEENADLFSDVAFRWLETNFSGALYYEYQDDYDKVIKFAHSKGIKCHASVVLMGSEQLHGLLSERRNRATLITNLMKEVEKRGYDGVNVDFEFLSPKDAELFTQFLTELKSALGPKRTLSVAVFARTENDKWPTGYDYEKIGEIADLVVVMAYDYSYSTSNPGPIAPIGWIHNVVSYMTNIIPREKVLLGMPTYGYDWGKNVPTATVTLKRLNNIKEKYTVNEYFDTNYMSPYYIYTDSNNNYHEIWLENERSLQEKWTVALDNKLGGISFWRIGNGFDHLYNVLKQSIPQE